MATATASTKKDAGAKKGARCPIRPLGDRVVVQAVDETVDRTAGGLYLPESAQEKPQLAEVVAVGPGKKNDEGKLVAINLKIGDRIFHSRYGGTTVKVSGEEYMIVREDDILAVYEG